MCYIIAYSVFLPDKMHSIKQLLEPVTSMAALNICKISLLCYTDRVAFPYRSLSKIKPENSGEVLQVVCKISIGLVLRTIFYFRKSKLCLCTCILELGCYLYIHILAPDLLYRHPLQYPLVSLIFIFCTSPHMMIRSYKPRNKSRLISIHLALKVEFLSGTRLLEMRDTINT